MNDQRLKSIETQGEYERHWRPAMNAESIEMKLREFVRGWTDQGRISKYNTFKSAGKHATPVKKEDVNIGKPEFWFALAKWAQLHDRLSPFERNFAFNIGVMLNK